MSKPKLKHRVEALALKLVFGIFAALPLDMASFIGGFIARAIGPFFRAHKIAESNLRMVMPELSDKRRNEILRGMWDNLGRVAAEYPHMPGNKLVSRVHLIGEENFPSPSRPAIYVSGHLGNWELTYPVAHRRGIPVALVYRPANNPGVDDIITKLRASQSDGAIAKGQRGAIKLMRALKSGQSLAILVDQKMNEGIPIPFFGRDAMTAPAVAQLAIKYDMPIFLARAIRTKGAHFEGILSPALATEKTGDEEKDVRTILLAINRVLEEWIREYPQQWFWVHKRWPSA